MSGSPPVLRLVAAVPRLAVKATELIAFAAVLGLFFVVAFNVVGRAVFDLTDGAINPMIPGAIELASYTLLIAVFAAFPVSLKHGMVRVDVLVGRFPLIVRRGLNRFWSLITLAVAIALVRLFFDEIATTYARGDITQVLRLPLWPVYVALTAECAVLALAALSELVAPSNIDGDLA
ncbi:TRAP-type C4-dicarboxylate transport system permease small subunit [Rhodobium orientis]|uniref:TRAP transporter small permease protein n=1 Tax=Rhodobium orientis TaxID=34017 RepID=A0A327JNG0_9HYPH|nr:TRAP transporter small permease [Rhodobium orientis]MBB4304951.1 TRAP-type C4-dicarboxylate transport system permease small subunit [Rhodobium orientis]MBK5951270.1 hypothetical protein [Rhodobium orientis]RAI27106.1 hypothetical protein CH339_11580 [Rhodobium orientis]